MEKRNTKEVILQESLNLFSIHGFEGVSVRDIAKAVGIKESSLYKHYQNKQAIFDSIISEMMIRYDNLSHNMGIPQGESSEAAKQYNNFSEDALIQMSKGLFHFFLKDEYASKFRRMLTIEQFRNPAASRTYAQIFIDGALDFQCSLFAEFITLGTFLEGDPYTMALQFYAPIFLLLNKYDHHPEQEEEAIEHVTQHVKQFNKIYYSREK